SREVLAGFTALAGASVELAEPQVAVGQDRTHAQLVSDGHGLPVRGFGSFRIWWVAMRSDPAQSAERPRFLVPSLVVAGEIDSLIDEPDRILFSAGQCIRLAQVGEKPCIAGQVLARSDLD